jgi:serine/threonine protein kinase
MGLDAPKPPLESIGHYDILAMIAEGGMGTVYKGRDRDTGQVVAIKIVPPTAARNPTLLKRFEREFSAARALDHPHIVKAIEFDGAGATPFLVMEYVDGESLGQRIERAGKLTEAESLRIIEQVCKGLYRAHKQGLIHRDVKPDNILLTRDGTAKVTDLGLVKDIAEDYNLTRTGRGLGTPHFMAPEQFRNAKNVDVRCDVYSLGATLYMMVTGVTPFGNCSALECFMKKARNDIVPPRERVPELSERVDWAIRRAMSPNAEQRPASCREFVEDLYGRSTRTPAQAEKAAGEGDLWYLVYRDEQNASHSAKGGTEAIRRGLRDGLLGDASNVVASRQKSGPFVALKSIPEFRDLLIAPEPLPPANAAPKPASASGRVPAPRSTPTANLGAPPAARLSAPGGGPSSRAALSGGGASGRATPPMSGAFDPTQSDRAARPADPSDRLPHVPLESPRRAGFDILLWLLVLVVAVATALVVFHFFPPP